VLDKIEGFVGSSRGQEFEEFRSSGVHEPRSSGVQELRSFRSSRSRSAKLGTLLQSM
jgi:hypothetical protein